MNIIRSYKDIPKEDYVPLIINILEGADATETIARKDILQAQAAAYDGIIAKLSESEALESIKADRDAINIELEALAKEVEESKYIQFLVKPMSPKETLKAPKLRPSEPKPPAKKREVPTLDQNNRIIPSLTKDEFYVDPDDPAYLKEMQFFEEEKQKTSERLIVYSLVCCVKGFDLSDEEIQEALGQKAHPKEPLDEYRKRLDQLGEILLDSISIKMMDSIMEKVNAISGVTADMVNFTLANSPLLS